MVKFYRKALTIFQQALLLVLVLLPGSSHAATTIENLAVTARVNQSGEISITQEIRYITPTQLSWTVFSRTDSLEVVKDGESLNRRSFRVGRLDDGTLISSQEFGSNWTIRYRAPGSLLRHNSRDQLFLKIIDKPNQPIYFVEINFFLPEGPLQKTGLTGNVYSLSGVAETTTTTANNRHLQANAQYAGPDSLLTLNANWDKSVIKLTPYQQARLAVSELDAAPWLAFGIILPIASLIVFLRLLIRQKRQEIYTPQARQKPPAGLAPVLVSVLIKKKIYAPGVAALIIDLCQRGYLMIVKRSGSYYITHRKQLDDNVEDWERKVIEEMFASDNTVKEETLQNLGSNKLYNPKVREAFLKIYRVIAERGYFKENPHATRIRNKLVALAIYYTSAVAMIWIAVAAGSPYLILPLVGTMVVAVLIIKFAPKLADYSADGIQARQDWLNFADFLKAGKPLPFEAAQNHSFEKYLAYAVALDCHLAWGRRFDLSSVIILKPDWFVSYEEGTTVEFAKEIAGFVNEVSKGITSLRGPLVS